MPHLTATTLVALAATTLTTLPANLTTTTTTTLPANLTTTTIVTVPADLSTTTSTTLSAAASSTLTTVRTVEPAHPITVTVFSTVALSTTTAQASASTSNTSSGPKDQPTAAPKPPPKRCRVNYQNWYHVLWTDHRVHVMNCDRDELLPNLEAATAEICERSKWKVVDGKNDDDYWVHWRSAIGCSKIFCNVITQQLPHGHLLSCVD